MEYRNNADVLLESLEFAGRRAVDVGCGVGFLTRLMAERGAEAVGIECNPAQLAKAREALPVRGETYLDGVAEDLPFAAGTLDIVVMSNSLHHVPVDKQERALREAARVLKPGGHLYVSEPLAEGGHFDLIRPVHDETDVRAHAYRMLKEKTAAAGLVEVWERVHLHGVLHADYEAFRDRIVGINPETAAAFAAKDAEMREAFPRLGRRVGDGRLFDQPTRVNLFRREG
jgi:ubiquinone/menaquinone biosynthesis C-methylase UbiE